MIPIGDNSIPLLDTGKGGQATPEEVILILQAKECLDKADVEYAETFKVKDGHG